jgi:pSer/pThr/pTyr-binding forkhead associated (FHA) protein
MKQKYELVAQDPKINVQGSIFAQGKILIGRSESCDLIINHDAISTVHAVFEISENKAMIYDMNSTNGTYVDEQKVFLKEIPLNTKFSLADLEFEFKKHIPLNAPAELPRIAPQVSNILSSDNEFTPLEYIFEDKDELYPIFKYESVNRATEVIILFKEKVFSIDYLPEGNLTYFLSGKSDNPDELEFPYLIKNQKVKFIDVHKGSCEVHALPGFEIVYLTDKKHETTSSTTTFELRDNDLVKLHKDDLQIFVRNVVAPPKIVASPVLKRDPDFRNSLFLSCFILFAVLLVANLVEKPTSVQIENRSIQRLVAILNRSP